MALLSHFRSTQHPGDQRQHSQLYHDKVSQAIFSRACPWLVSSPACCIQLLPSLLGTWPYFASLYIPQIFFSHFFHADFLFILFAHLSFFHLFHAGFLLQKKKKKKISGSIFLHPLSCGSSCIFPLFSLSFICASFIILDLGDRVLGRENKACCARFSTVVF